jgi:hypothetical protein
MADEAAAPPANETPKPGFWVVQTTSGGIPQDPVLFDSHAEAEQYFAECVVAGDLPFDGSSGCYAGNDDDEIRIFGPANVFHPSATPSRSHWNHEKRAFDDTPFSLGDQAEADRILRLMRGQDEATHYLVDEGGVLVRGPKAVVRLTCHDDGNGIIGIDIYGWTANERAPRTMEEADEDLDSHDIEGGFFWDLSPTGWKNHSEMVSEMLGRTVTLEEGGEKTDWKENEKTAKAQGA